MPPVLRPLAAACAAAVARIVLPAALAAAAVAASAAPPAGQPRVEFVGSHQWQLYDPDFGGYSGLEVSDDGNRYWALSDRGTLRWGSLERDAQGRITGLTTAGDARLQSSRGAPLTKGYLGDAEGLVRDDRGRFFVSFEGFARVMRYDDPDRPGVPLPRARFYLELGKNEGMEALAITPAGDLLTLPETWKGAESPVWRFHDDAWAQFGTIPRDPEWAAVGADVGPDGRFYLLERQFRGAAGFASRVRRFDIGAAGLTGPQVLLTSGLMQFDNLEGIAVWRDGTGIRLTMISDDNFFFLQHTQLVEYRVVD